MKDVHQFALLFACIAVVARKATDNKLALDTNIIWIGSLRGSELFILEQFDLEVWIDVASRVNEAHSDNFHTNITVVFHARGDSCFLDVLDGCCGLNADSTKLTLALKNTTIMGIENLGLFVAGCLLDWCIGWGWRLKPGGAWSLGRGGFVGGLGGLVPVDLFAVEA